MRLFSHYVIVILDIMIQPVNLKIFKTGLTKELLCLFAAHIAPSPSPLFASETVMQCMQERV